jgi:hypothetical protein
MPKRKRDSVDGEADQSPEWTPEQDFPWLHPSNSPRALQLRRAREAEIEMILKEDEAFEHVLSGSTDSDDGILDLRIRRPPNHQNLEDRYRKQGLTKNDYGRIHRERVQYSDLANADHTGHNPKRRKGSRSSSDEARWQARVCYCGQANYETAFEVIKCTAKLCRRLYFHLDCIDPQDMPEDGSAFICIDCQDGQQHKISNHLHIVPVKSLEYSLGDVQTKGLLLSTPEHESTFSDISTSISEPDSPLKAADMACGDDERSDECADSKSDTFGPADRAFVREPMTPPRTGFLAINNFADPRHPMSPDSLGAMGGLSKESPGQLDGHHTSDPHYTAMQSFGAHENRVPGQERDSIVDAGNRALVPHFHAFAPFHALAPFMQPSTSESDPYFLTADEARYASCWRGACPITPLFTALPKEKQASLVNRSHTATAGLSHWWAGEIKKMAVRIPALSDVLKLNEEQA